jgi:nucleoside phosphorylase
MKTYSIVSAVALAAAALLSATGAHAALGQGEGTPGYAVETDTQATSVKRADVRAEAARAVAEGRIASGEVALADTPAAWSATSRAQVRAEAAEAVRLGLVASGEQALVYTAPQLAQIRAAGLTLVAGQR